MERGNMRIIKNFLRDEAGLEFSEYVVASFLVTLAVIAAFTSVGSAVRDKIITLAGFLN
jgi:Flp pilus assembly pilin Flp